MQPTGFPTLQTASQLPQPFPRKASSCPRRPRVVVGIIVAECGVPRWPVHPRSQETDGAGQMAGSQGSFRAIFDSARCKSTGSIGCNFSQLTSTSWRGRVLHFNESVSPTFADRAPDSASVPSTDENEDREVLSKWLMLVSTSGSFDLHEWGMDRGNRGVEPGEGAGAPSRQRQQENGRQGPGNHCCRNLVAFGHVRMRT